MWIDSIIEDGRTSKVNEIRGLARALKQWREPIIKKIKRVAAR
jgi:hypothetical protein